MVVGGLEVIELHERIVDLEVPSLMQLGLKLTNGVLAFLVAAARLLWRPE